MVYYQCLANEDVVTTIEYQGGKIIYIFSVDQVFFASLEKKAFKVYLCKSFDYHKIRFVQFVKKVLLRFDPILRKFKLQTEF